jgi:hypothetical protein
MARAARSHRFGRETNPFGPLTALFCTDVDQVDFVVIRPHCLNFYRFAGAAEISVRASYIVCLGKMAAAMRFQRLTN